MITRNQLSGIFLFIGPPFFGSSELAFRSTLYESKCFDKMSEIVVPSSTKHDARYICSNQGRTNNHNIYQPQEVITPRSDRSDCSCQGLLRRLIA